ncbi:MAG: response regulator [Thermodesulfobacteriota bacterium]
MHKAKVLLVDDEEMFVEMLAQRLEARGLEVAKAFDGDQALQRVREKDYDVVILDVLMPGKGGVDVLKEIKQIKPLTEVIMLTGHATVDTAIQGMKFGAYDYLLKPTETEDLMEKIQGAHKRKSEQEERIRKAEIERITITKGW